MQVAPIEARAQFAPPPPLRRTPRAPHTAGRLIFFWNEGLSIGRGQLLLCIPLGSAKRGEVEITRHEEIVRPGDIMPQSSQATGRCRIKVWLGSVLSLRAGGTGRSKVRRFGGVGEPTSLDGKSIWPQGCNDRLARVFLAGVT